MKIDWILSQKIMLVMIPVAFLIFLELVVKDRVIKYNQKAYENVYEYKKCIKRLSTKYSLVDSKKSCKIILDTPTKITPVYMLPYWDIGDEYILTGEDL